jgi:hypothetical protein
LRAPVVPHSEPGHTDHGDADGDLHLVTMFAPRKVQAIKELRNEGFSIVVDRAEIVRYAKVIKDAGIKAD